ncbi:MAG TPA: hypothetical protein VLB73_02785 [Patescibacteria group bacterium]|nr:hypothetical protein [Patescibacteria group bacterium]
MATLESQPQFPVNNTRRLFINTLALLTFLGLTIYSGYLVCNYIAQNEIGMPLWIASGDTLAAGGFTTLAVTSLRRGNRR